MDPINYSKYMQQPDILGGLVKGMQLKDMLTQRSQQQALQEKYKSDLSDLTREPSRENVMNFMLAHPEQASKFKPMYDAMGETEKQNTLKTGYQLYSAIRSGNPDIVEKTLNERIAAADNSGIDSSVLKSTLELYKEDPKAAEAQVAIKLASIDPKFTETVTKLGGEQRDTEKHPLEMRKLESEILTTAENTRLRAMEAALRREDNELKRKELQLKVDALKNKAQVGAKERAAEASSAIETFDRIIGTIDKIASHPGLEKATGLTSFMAIVPGTEAKDVSALIDTLKSQAFSAEVVKMKGLGALSENEGKKLETSVSNLDRAQTTKAFKDSLNTALKIFKLGRDRAKDKYADVLEEPEETTTYQEGATATNPATGAKMIFRNGNWEAI